jgi:hypothetical protein
MPTTARPVTGPDGDSPITDEQIRELRKIGAIDWRTFHTAIVNPDPDSKRTSCTACAAAWNARQGAKP